MDFSFLNLTSGEIVLLIPFVLIFIVLPIAVIRWLWRNGRK